MPLLISRFLHQSLSSCVTLTLFSVYEMDDIHVSNHLIVADCCDDFLVEHSKHCIEEDDLYNGVSSGKEGPLIEVVFHCALHGRNDVVTAPSCYLHTRSPENGRFHYHTRPILGHDKKSRHT